MCGSYSLVVYILDQIKSITFIRTQSCPTQVTALPDPESTGASHTHPPVLSKMANGDVACGEVGDKAEDLRRLCRWTALAPSLVLIVIPLDEGTNEDAFELSPEALLELEDVGGGDDGGAGTLPTPTAVVTEMAEWDESADRLVDGRMSWSWSSSTWSVCTYGASSFHESSSTSAGVGSIVPSSL